MQVSNINSRNSSYYRHTPAFKNINRKEPEIPKKVKAGVFLTTLLGVSTALALTLKGKKCLKNPLKTPIKEWGIFSANYSSSEIPGFIGKLAIGSVTGGLIGGAIFDKKENMKAKYRESIIQLIGNVATPLLCVAGGMKLLEKYQGKLKGKAALLGKIITSGVCLLGGIYLGNKVGNTINEKAFKIKSNRKLKLSDLSPHIDDLCLVLSFVAAESSKVITRLIPVALMVAGYSTGVAQESVQKRKQIQGSNQNITI